MVALRLSELLAKRGIEAHYFSYAKPFALNNQLENWKFHQVKRTSYPLFKDVGPPYSIALANLIAKKVNQNGISIINSHYGLPHSVSAYLAKQIVKFSSIVSLHGSDVYLTGNSDDYKEIFALSLKNSEEIIAVSNFLAQLAKKHFDLHKKPKVIYNGIDTDLFTPSNEERRKSIVHASNFREIKRVPFLIDIFSRISADFPDWELILIGDGPERVECMKQVRLLNLKDRVKFLGTIINIPEAFSNAGIVAVPSEQESFGLTIAEGMSSEAAIWASDVGGIPEVCIDGKNGLLFNSNDKEEAEDKLRELISNSSLRIKLGKAGRERIKEKFSVNKILEEYIGVYNKFG